MLRPTFDTKVLILLKQSSFAIVAKILLILFCFRLNVILIVTRIYLVIFEKLDTCTISRSSKHIYSFAWGFTWFRSFWEYLSLSVFPRKNIILNYPSTSKQMDTSTIPSSIYKGQRVLVGFSFRPPHFILYTPRIVYQHFIQGILASRSI